MVALFVVGEEPKQDQAHRGKHHQCYEGAKDENPNVVHRLSPSVEAMTSAPSAKIDGTHKPTKTPWSLFPKNHNDTESANDANAANKNK